MADRELIDVLHARIMRELDMSATVSDGEVLRLIDTVLSGEAGIPLGQKLDIRYRLFNKIRRMDILSELLEDDSISEIMINGYDKIFVERAGRIERWDQGFESPEKLMSVVQQIVSNVNRRVNDACPIADAILSDGSRVNIVLEGVSCDGTAVTIRKFPDKCFDMRQLIGIGSLSEEVAAFLEMLVYSGYNLFISGGTGAGKTTFLNALTEFIPSDERVITIEDSAELQVIGIDNLVRLEARSANVEGANEISIRDLIRSSLRMRPDRIIVGEVRDSAAIDMLQAMCTGHDGSLSTGHANSAHEMLMRLESMVLTGADLPLKAVRQQIAAAIDIVVHLGRLRDRSRRVLEIREVVGLEGDDIVTRELYRFEESGEKDGRVIGELKKINDLLSVGKLIAAGRFTVEEKTYGT